MYEFFIEAGKAFVFIVLIISFTIFLSPFIIKVSNWWCNKVGI